MLLCAPFVAADVYMLLTGNRAIGSPRNMANQPRTGVYKMPRGGDSWTLLRGQVGGAWLSSCVVNTH